MADTALGGAAGGAMKGASLGSTLGSVIPGIGNAVGAVGGAIIGGISGGMKSKKAQEQKETAQGFVPGYQDPTQVQRLAEIDQISKNLQSGTDSATQTALGQIQGQTAQTQSRLARVTGGNIGATVDALLKAQRAGGESANQAIAQGQSRLPFFKGLGQDLANRIEQRKLDLSLLNRDQAYAEAAQAQKENVINRNAALASGLGVNELGDAASRIQGLFNNMKLNQSAPAGGDFQMPEQPVQIPTVGGQSGSLLGSIAPGTEVMGGQSLTGLTAIPGFQ